MVSITINPYEGLKPNMLSHTALSVLVSITINPYEGLKLYKTDVLHIGDTDVSITINPYEGLKHSFFKRDSHRHRMFQLQLIPMRD